MCFYTVYGVELQRKRRAMENDVTGQDSADIREEKEDVTAGGRVSYK